MAPSIARPFVGHPNAKPAGERCVRLDTANRCLLFGRPERPRFCVDLRPPPSMCGGDSAAALAILAALERDTRAGR
ncbi:MAG: YkgJ family cysteine cluster protein [Planctomycetes bacterium]|nr:YkgJ family cysteine cluster protein [Planctomycetota bacterium]